MEPEPNRRKFVKQSDASVPSPREAMLKQVADAMGELETMLEFSGAAGSAAAPGSTPHQESQEGSASVGRRRGHGRKLARDKWPRARDRLASKRYRCVIEEHDGMTQQFVKGVQGCVVNCRVQLALRRCILKRSRIRIKVDTTLV